MNRLILVATLCGPSVSIQSIGQFSRWKQQRKIHLTAAGIGCLIGIYALYRHLSSPTPDEHNKYDRNTCYKCRLRCRLPFICNCGVKYCMDCGKTMSEESCCICLQCNDYVDCIMEHEEYAENPFTYQNVEDNDYQEEATNNIEPNDDTPPTTIIQLEQHHIVHPSWLDYMPSFIKLAYGRWIED